MTPSRSDVGQVILDVLDAVAAEPPPRNTRWIPQYGGYSDSLSGRVAKLYRERFPDRRNSPQHRHAMSALKALIDEGLVEHKEGEHDDLYRRARREAER